jgi:hypothetical protein
MLPSYCEYNGAKGLNRDYCTAFRDSHRHIIGVSRERKRP